MMFATLVVVSLVGCFLADARPIPKSLTEIEIAAHTKTPSTISHADFFALLRCLVYGAFSLLIATVLSALRLATWRFRRYVESNKHVLFMVDKRMLFHVV